MDNFKSGPAFFAINEFHFSHYESCQNSAAMLQAQELVKSELAKEKEELKNRKIDYGSDSSDHDSEEERKYYEDLNRKIIEKERIKELEQE